MSRSQRTKGASFEREMARLLAGVYPGARRGIGQARDSREVPDVDNTPFWVECKVGQRPNVYAAFRQAEEARDDRPTLVIARKNPEKPFDTRMDLAVVGLDTMVELLGELDRRLMRWPFWERES